MVLTTAQYVERDHKPSKYAGGPAPCQVQVRAADMTSVMSIKICNAL